MEAIAHSPSFAKKAGVPQSVGKDYAAADKGKTFSKGGEMKESKGMVGKEVAFFKKKGAPKSMIKHEEAEMKGMKKGGRVRRMAEGGETDMSMGYGDPFAKPRDYDKEKAQGADTVKRLKNFFGFGSKEEAQPEKPVNKPPSTTVNAAPVTLPVSAASVRNPESDQNESTVRGPQFANSVSDRGIGELSGDGLTPAQGPAKEPATRRISKVSAPIEVEKTKTKVTAMPGSRRSGATAEELKSYYGSKPESGLRKSGATAEELERYAGPFRVTESANKMRKDAEDKIRDSKPGSMTKQMREAKTGRELYAGQKTMGQEVDDYLKSFRASIRGGLKTAEERRKMREAETGAAKGGPVKKMASGGSVDGIAKKGKTQGKVVKMASGGFVKNADGCAQRGKTKAFQVKMSRGGKC